jgi:hypothetical protein
MNSLNLYCIPRTAGKCEATTTAPDQPKLHRGNETSNANRRGSKGSPSRGKSKLQAQQSFTPRSSRHKPARSGMVQFQRSPSVLPAVG